MDAGARLFAAGRFDEAAVRFEAAAVQALEEGLDPAVASYDRATALLRAGDSASAAAIFLESLRSGDPGLREKAHFNRGNALAEEALGREKAGDAAGAVQLLGRALEDYERAMAIDPGDEDPKVNHELAALRKARLEKQLGERGAGRSQPSGPGAPAPQAQGEQRRQEREMTREEALSMLDALRQQEDARRTGLAPRSGRPVPAGKNW
jgi:tetratricopeptide (TPR) repeat protein